MFECSICGLLSLNAVSCPACGSQNLKDLSALDSDSDDLPSEIPGLDDAAQSWHDLEGVDEEVTVDSSNTESSTKDGNLPFGFSGASNIQESRLPFGIGSHAEGIPFDNDAQLQPVDGNEGEFETHSEVSSSRGASGEAIHDDSTSTQIDANEPINLAIEGNPVPRRSVDEPRQDLAEVVIKRQNPLRIQPIIQTDTEHNEADVDTPLPTDFELPNEDIDAIPDEWRITAIEANMDEIYSTENAVVEVVHQYEEDVVVFEHKEQELYAAPQAIDLDDSNILSLELHPARAMDVDLSSNPECREDLDSGYFAIAKNSWAEAAIKFQQIATRMPGDSAVYNNYGLALLQRAIEMAKSSDESVQILAESQFESAILALREAAKSAPNEPIILLNLAHALLVSGRSEKALKIITVHNSKHPNSVEGINLEAATLVSIGQSVNAKTKLSKFRGDAIVDENLARLL